MIQSILTVSICAMFGSYLAVNMGWVDDFAKDYPKEHQVAAVKQPVVEKKLSFTERVTQKTHKATKL